MPYNDSTLPFADLSPRDRVAAVFTYKWFAAIEHPAFAHVPPPVKRGRRSEYPPLMQFMVLVLSRVFASQREALNALNKDGLWAECCTRYRALVKTDINLPSAPPTAANMDAYLHRYFGIAEVSQVEGETRTIYRPNEDALSLLRSEFTAVALAQAFKQGQIPLKAGAPDFANPDKRFTFFGDGTWVEPYSKAVRVAAGKAGKEVVLNSRAEHGRHRVPDVCRRGKIDGKNVVGINNIFIAMWTDAGRIVVSADQTIDGENIKALAMIRELIDQLDGRVHTVVWDKALSGMVLHEFLAHHRTLILTKIVARNSNSTHSDGYTARDNLSADEAFAILDNDGCLPLGTSVQGNHSEREMIRSKFHRDRHQIAEIDTCPRDHELWVDGDVLWDTYRDPNDLGIYKRAAARSTRAVPRKAATLAQDDMKPIWEVPADWELPCREASGGVHRFTTLWEPIAIANGRPADGPQKPMHDLRPIGAEDPRFWDTFKVRNNAESLNSLYKKMFRNSEHAMRLRAHEQLVDQIAAGFAMNAVTWLTNRRQQADAKALASGVANVVA